MGCVCTCASLFRFDTWSIFLLVAVHSDHFKKEVPHFVSKAKHDDSIHLPIDCIAVARRCYCLLSKFPFFEAHFEILHSIIGDTHLGNMYLTRERTRTLPCHSQAMQPRDRNEQQGKQSSFQHLQTYLRTAQKIPTGAVSCAKSASPGL